LPAPADEERLHHLAHEQCFIANSIKTEVTVGGTKDETSTVGVVPRST
jgi:organic hydroperoxide reductase OsmC/OhrA